MLGTNIKMGMAKQGLSVQELADDVGVSRQTVSSWIHNKATPSQENIDKLCETFDTTKSKFYGWTE